MKQTIETAATIPAAVDVERAILGGAMCFRELCETVLPLLADDDFYDSRHAAIFKALKTCAAGGQVDLVTVADELERAGTLAAAGDTIYLSEVCDHVPGGPETARAYCRILKEKSGRRAAIRAGLGLADAARDPETGFEETVDGHLRAIENIQEQGTETQARAVADFLPDVFAGLSSDGPAGIRTGFRPWDSSLGGVFPGEIFIIAGRSGSGKSTLTAQLAAGVSEGGLTVAFFSLEMTGNSLAVRELCRRANFPAAAARTRKLLPDEIARLENHAAAVAGLPLFIVDRPGISTEEIKAESRIMKRKNGLGLVVVDYLQLVKPSGQCRIREEAVAGISRDLKTLALAFEVPVVVCCQLNRQSESRDDKRPRLSDLRESGAIEQDADAVVLLHRPDEYADDAELIVAKNRHGPTGTVRATFQRETFNFSEGTV